MGSCSMHKTGVGGKPQSMRAPIAVKPTEQRRQARKDSAKDPAAATIHCFHCSRLQVFRARIGPTSHLCTHRPGQPHPPWSWDSSHRRHRRTNNNITHFITLYINNVFTCKRHGFFYIFGPEGVIYWIKLISMKIITPTFTHCQLVEIPLCKILQNTEHTHTCKCSINISNCALRGLL